MRSDRYECLICGRHISHTCIWLQEFSCAVSALRTAVSHCSCGSKFEDLRQFARCDHNCVTAKKIAAEYFPILAAAPVAR